MTKEQILEAVKELVRTLKSPNFKEPKVQQLWREKQIEVQESLQQLPASDLKWLNEEYLPWHKVEVLPDLDGEMAELARKKDFSWI
jgi:hypothetical protein